MTSADTPYLSIVLVGRNDGFGGDFNERFFRALRFNHERLSDAGISHELVFVEWAPIAGKPYLANLILAELPELSDVLTAYIVDARYHEAFSQNPKLQFMEFVAKNVGIRRARGTFILASNTDIYLSEGVVEALARQDLDAATLYRATRVDVKLSADLTHVDWALLDDARNHAAVNVMIAPLFTNGAGDFQLMDRVSWMRLRGFNEVFRVAKIHVDGNFCAKAYANGYRLVDIGAPVFHLEHIGSFNIVRSLYEDNPGDAPWGHNRWKWRVIYENPAGWGLGDAPARLLGPATQYVDYTPNAVPPLLDLRRVLLPVARVGTVDV